MINNQYFINILDPDLGKCIIKLIFPSENSHFLEVERQSHKYKIYRSSIVKNKDLMIKEKKENKLITNEMIMNFIINQSSIDFRYDSEEDDISIIFSYSKLEPGKEKPIGLYSLSAFDYIDEYNKLNIEYIKVSKENTELKKEYEKAKNSISKCKCKCKSYSYINFILYIQYLLSFI